MLWNVLSQTWAFSRQAAPYLLFGFLLAGLIRAFMNEKTIARWLGGRGFKSVLNAAVIGAPLPLCSCSVLPTAAALRKQGASRAATTSFLISTPETGVDSVAVSWAMLDPVMTVARPIAALFTALVTGAAEVLLHPERGTDSPPAPAADIAEKAPLIRRLRQGVRYGYLSLMADLAWYLLWGLLLAGVVSAFLPADLLTGLPGGDWTAMALVIALGVPLYICATSSTPLAAALIVKGVSPGAALLLLLVGPATNISSLSVIWRILGPRSTVIYLAGIVVSGVACALGLNYAYRLLSLAPSAAGGVSDGGLPGWIGQASAVVLWLLIAYGVYKEKVRPLLRRRRAAA